MMLEQAFRFLPEINGPVKLDETCRRLRENDPTLTRLNLRNNQIDDDGARALAKALETNSTLTWLDLGDNLIGVDGAKALASALATNSTLQVLRLGRNQIGDAGVRALATALATNSTLKELHLGGNQIGDVGATALATALATNSTLKELHLGVNQIGDDSAEALATALATNSTLQKLSLWNNQIGVDGGKALLQTLQQHNGSLTCLYLDDNQGISHDLKSEIQALVTQNEHKTRNPQPRPKLTRKEFAEKNLPISACNGDWEALAGLLDHAVNVDAVDSDGSTALYYASEQGQVNAARILMDRGAKAYASCKGGKTPLMAASKNGHAEIVQLLLDHGANADLKVGRFRKQSALDMAQRNGHFQVVSILEAQRQGIAGVLIDRSPVDRASPPKPEEAAKLKERHEQEAERLRQEELALERSRQERELERQRLEQEATERRRLEEEAARLRLEEQRAEEQRLREQEAERMRLEREAAEKHRLAEEQRKQEEESKQEQFRKDCAEKFQARVALDQEIQRLQDFVEAARGVTDADVTSAAASAKAEYEALVPLQSLPQWASVTDLEKQVASLGARLQSISVGEEGAESANELMELKRRLDVERLTPEQYNALQKLTSNIEDFDRSLESVQGLPKELEAMPKHIQAYFFAFCQSFERTYLAAEVISSGTVAVDLTSKFQGTIATVLNAVGKGLEVSNVPFLGCASIIISLYTYQLERKQKNFLWIFQDFFNGNSRDGYMLAYRRIAKKICGLDNFSDFEIGEDKDNASIIQKLKTSILEPLTKVVSCHLRKVHLISLEELDPIGLKVIDDLHTITIVVLQLWDEDRDRYNDLKQADEDEKATFVLECLGVIAKGSCMKHVGDDSKSSKSSKVQPANISGKQARRAKEVVASEPLVEQHGSTSEEAAKLSEIEELRSRVKVLESKDKRKTQVIKRLEKLIPDDEVDVGSGGGGRLKQALVSKKTNAHSHSSQSLRMDKDERMRVHYLERRVDLMSRQLEEERYKNLLMGRVLSFSETWQLVENILRRSSDSISGRSNKNKAVRPHKALVPDEEGFFVVGNRKLRIGTVPDSKEKIWEKGHDIKIYHNNHKVKSVRYWFEANGLGYRFQLHCKPAVWEMFSDEITMAYDTFESTFSEPGVQQDYEKEDANRSTLFDT